jgi:nucleotide-binding universal stress UspA family protein
MFKTIVWATDGSESADRALPYVKSLAAQDGAAVVIVHSEEQLVGRGGGVRVHVDEPDLITKIQRQAAELQNEGIDATTKMVGGIAGGAAHRIADEAAAAQADLIVVGTRGHTPLAGLLVGSVTQRLLHIAPCPVLAVPTRNGVTEV